MKARGVQPQRATLVMESGGYAPQVRSGGYTSSWSRLYRSDGLLIDLNYRPLRDEVRFEGQLLSEHGVPLSLTSVRLEGADGNVTTSQPDDSGFFAFQVDEPGETRLVLELADGCVQVSGLLL